MQFLFEGKWLDLLYAYQFIKRLVAPFEATEAYRLGIIDKNGNNLIPRKDFTSEEQKNAYTYYNVMVFNLKKLLGKLPGGKTQFASFVAGLLLLKEQKNREFQMIQENNLEFLEKQYITLYETMNKRRSELHDILSELEHKRNQELITEEDTGDLPTLQVPTSTVAALRKKQAQDSMIRRKPLVDEEDSEEETESLKSLVKKMYKGMK